MGVHADQLLVGLAAEVVAVVDDVGHVEIDGVLDAFFLLDDGACCGHGAAGKVERAAGGRRHFQNDDLLRAGFRGVDGGGEARAARADDDEIGVRGGLAEAAPPARSAAASATGWPKDTFHGVYILLLFVAVRYHSVCFVPLYQISARMKTGKMGRAGQNGPGRAMTKWARQGDDVG